jgi:hypothetical protein
VATVEAATAAATAEAAVANSPGSGSTGAALSPTAIGYISFGTTIVVVIALFVAGILPLWLAAVILVADGAFTYLLVTKLEAGQSG